MSQRGARIALTGANGQLGRCLQGLAPHGLELALLPRNRLDITDRAAVCEALAALHPDWVVNAAAYTAVDRAENEPEAAFAVNAGGAAHLAEGCAQVGARMVQISTDYVFDGTKGSPYAPGDPPNPINVYGQSKLDGEERVREILGERALILRTAWVYSVKGPSFLTTMLCLMRVRKVLHVVEDQISTPTSVANLARAVFAAVDHELVGVYHWTDSGVASWYDFAVAIAEEARNSALLRHDLVIHPIPASEYRSAAQRPLFSVLDKTTTRERLNLCAPHWRESLRASLGLGERTVT